MRTVRSVHRSDDPTPEAAARLGRLHGRYVQAQNTAEGWHRLLCLELAEIRDEQDLSVRAIARTLDVSSSTVQKWLRHAERIRAGDSGS